MKPIQYETHCASCHQLNFNAQLSGDPDSGRIGVLPHVAPDILRHRVEFINKAFNGRKDRFNAGRTWSR